MKNHRMKKNLKEKLKMSDMARELIQQALDQDYNNANKTFGEIMNTKLDDVLNQEKVRMADAVYNGGEPDDEDDVLGDEDGDQLELDLETEGDDEEQEETEEESEIFDADDDELPLDPEE